MSDLADDAHNVGELGARGAVFSVRAARQTTTRKAANDCEHCGAQPRFRPADDGKEILGCTVCIRKTTPGRSRQQLTQEWNVLNEKRSR